MDSICLNIPFMVLSTKVNRVGEIEKRFFTPFGTIDVTFRNVLDVEKQKSHLDIEVGGDVERWASYNSAIIEFRTALLHFVLGIAKDHLGEEAHLGFNEVSIHIKGAEINLTAPCGNIVSGEWETCNYIGHA